MKCTRKEWAIELEKRKLWDWNLSDCELSRRHSVVRPCVQKTRIKLGIAPFKQIIQTPMPVERFIPDEAWLIMHVTPSDCFGQSGIYGFRNEVDGKWYVGQSVSIDIRQKYHLRDLIRGIHYNQHFQSAFTLHGQSQFRFFVLELCSRDDLNAREVFWIDKLKSNDRRFGYNYESGGGVNKGVSQETIERIRIKNTGRKRTPEQCALLSIARTGNPLSDKQRAQLKRMHDANKGRKRTQEQIAKQVSSRLNNAKPLSQSSLENIRRAAMLRRGKPSHMRGKKHAPETLLKMSLAKLGKPSPHRGKKISLEARLNMSRSHAGEIRPWLRGKKWSAEHRAKMSAGQKRRFAREAMFHD